MTYIKMSQTIYVWWFSKYNKQGRLEINYLTVLLRSCNLQSVLRQPSIFKIVVVGHRPDSREVGIHLHHVNVELHDKSSNTILQHFFFFYQLRKYFQTKALTSTPTAIISHIAFRTDGPMAGFYYKRLETNGIIRKQKLF